MNWFSSLFLRNIFLDLQALGKASCILKSEGLEPSEVTSRCHRSPSSKVLNFVTWVHASVSQDVGMSLSPLFVCMRTVDAPLCSMFDCTLNSCLLSAHCSGSLIRSPSSPPTPPSLPASSPSLSFVLLLFSQTFPSLLSLPLPLLTYSYSPPMSIIVTDTALDRLSPMSHDSPTVPLHQIYFCPLPACLYHHVLEEQGRN